MATRAPLQELPLIGHIPETISEISLDSIEKYIRQVCLIASSSAGSKNDIAQIFESFEKTKELKNEKFVSRLLGGVFNEILYMDGSSKTSEKKLLVLFYNGIVKNVPQSIMALAVEQLDTFFVYRLMDFLEITGNFDLQMTLVEALFRTYGSKYLKQKASALLTGEGHEFNVLRKLFTSITKENFFEDTRLFLNASNKRTSKVFSIKANSIEIDDYMYIHKDKNKKFWVDINQVDAEVSWYLPKSEIPKLVLDSALPSEDLVLVTLNLVDVIKTDVLGSKTNEYYLIFKLKGDINIDTLNIQIQGKKCLKIKFLSDNKFHMCVDEVLSGLLCKKIYDTEEPTLKKISSSRRITKSNNDSSCLNSIGIKSPSGSGSPSQAEIISITDMTENNSISSQQYDTALICDVHKVWAFKKQNDYKELPITLSTNKSNSNSYKTPDRKKSSAKYKQFMDEEIISIEEHNNNVVEPKKSMGMQKNIRTGKNVDNSSVLKQTRTSSAKKSKTSICTKKSEDNNKLKERKSDYSQLSMIAKNCSFDRDMLSSLGASIASKENKSCAKDLIGEHFSEIPPVNIPKESLINAEASPKSFKTEVPKISLSQPIESNKKIVKKNQNFLEREEDNLRISKNSRGNNSMAPSQISNPLENEPNNKSDSEQTQISKVSETSAVKNKVEILQNILLNECSAKNNKKTLQEITDNNHDNFPSKKAKLTEIQKHLNKSQSTQNNNKKANLSDEDDDNLLSNSANTSLIQKDQILISTTKNVEKLEIKKIKLTHIEREDYKRTQQSIKPKKSKKVKLSKKLLKIKNKKSDLLSYEDDEYSPSKSSKMSEDLIKTVQDTEPVQRLKNNDFTSKIPIKSIQTNVTAYPRKGLKGTNSSQIYQDNSMKQTLQSKISTDEFKINPKQRAQKPIEELADLQEHEAVKNDDNEYAKAFVQSNQEKIITSAEDQAAEDLDLMAQLSQIPQQLNLSNEKNDMPLVQKEKKNKNIDLPRKDVYTCTKQDKQLKTIHKRRTRKPLKKPANLQEHKAVKKDDDKVKEKEKNTLARDQPAVSSKENEMPYMDLSKSKCDDNASPKQTKVTPNRRSRKLIKEPVDLQEQANKKDQEKNKTSAKNRADAESPDLTVQLSQITKKLNSSSEEDELPLAQLFHKIIDLPRKDDYISNKQGKQSIITLQHEAVKKDDDEDAKVKEKEKNNTSANDQQAVSSEDNEMPLVQNILNKKEMKITNLPRSKYDKKTKQTKETPKRRYRKLLRELADLQEAEKKEVDEDTKVVRTKKAFVQNNKKQTKTSAKNRAAAESPDLTVELSQITQKLNSSIEEDERHLVQLIQKENIIIDLPLKDDRMQDKQSKITPAKEQEQEAVKKNDAKVEEKIKSSAKDQAVKSPDLPRNEDYIYNKQDKQSKITPAKEQEQEAGKNDDKVEEEIKSSANDQAVESPDLTVQLSQVTQKLTSSSLEDEMPLVKPILKKKEIQILDSLNQDDDSTSPKQGQESKIVRKPVKKLSDLKEDLVNRDNVEDTEMVIYTKKAFLQFNEEKSKTLAKDQPAENKKQIQKNTGKPKIVDKPGVLFASYLGPHSDIENPISEHSDICEEREQSNLDNGSVDKTNIEDVLLDNEDIFNDDEDVPENLFDEVNKLATNPNNVAPKRLERSNNEEQNVISSYEGLVKVDKPLRTSILETFSAIQNTKANKPVYSVKSSKTTKRILYDGEETHLEELKLEVSKMDMEKRENIKINKTVPQYHKKKLNNKNNTALHELSYKEKLTTVNKTIKKIGRKRKYRAIKNIPSDFESDAENNISYDDILSSVIRPKKTKLRNRNSNVENMDLSDNEEARAALDDFFLHVKNKSKMFLKLTKNSQQITALKQLKNTAHKYLSKSEI
ncbi:unnamed protein product [Brassicogethes aeneus]|uniref:Uncharacterized protein n=1 Tax=Brassicogethes aeneus TaxID=1431903 RepID=A0A9P0B0R7_BRAAE|nr:unnamed protein product [Brassicogethes aeneus]